MFRPVDFLLDALVSRLVATVPWAPPAAMVALLALPGGILVALVWRRTVPPARAKRAADRSWARLLGIAVYRDEPAALLRAAVGLMATSLMRLCLLLPAMATAAAVLALSYGVLDAWFALRPFMPGEEARLTVRFRAGQWGTPGLRTAGGAPVGLPPLHNRMAGEVEWRVPGETAGATALTIDYAGTNARTELRVGPGLCRLQALAISPAGWRRWFNRSGGLPADGPFERVEIHYPPRTFLTVGEWAVPWWGLYVGVMLGVAQALRIRPGGKP